MLHHLPVSILTLTSSVGAETQVHLFSYIKKQTSKQKKKLVKFKWAVGIAGYSGFLTSNTSGVNLARELLSVCFLKIIELFAKKKIVSMANG